MAAVRDVSTADCRFEGQHDVQINNIPLTTWTLSYLSWESVDGALRPIRIRAFATRPRKFKGRLPGVVQAHGLGGAADEESASMLAARLGMFAIAYSGPGSGTDPSSTSEGRPSSFASGYQLFDTKHDVRGSWFWAHTMAALRALTCLGTRSDVDPRRLGMTGFSAGAVASLIVAGIDDRVRAVVPLSGSLAWREAVRSETAWERALLAQSHLDLSSPEWDILNRELIDPLRTHAGAATKIFMINGTTDEFFPLTAHLATLRKLSQTSDVGETRTSLIGNYDHGCYKTLGDEPSREIGLRASIRAEGGQRAWFRHYLFGDSAYAVIPRPPVVTATTRGTMTLFSASIDKPSSLDIEEVRLWWSYDNAYHYDSLLLDPKAVSRYEKLTTLSTQAPTIYFVDVQYRTRERPEPHRFSISSEPVIPPDLIPHIRAYGVCQ